MWVLTVDTYLPLPSAHLDTLQRETQSFKHTKFYTLNWEQATVRDSVMVDEVLYVQYAWLHMQ